MANKKMTNYEAIKDMSLGEVAAMFYIFAKPFFEVLEMNKEQKKEALEAIREFLKSECAKKQ